jgi:hypothetical protein
MIMNWKGLWMKRSWPNRGNIHIFSWRDWGKPPRTWISITGVPVEFKGRIFHSPLRVMTETHPVYKTLCMWNVPETKGSPDSSAGIATGNWLEGRCSIPGRDKRPFSTATRLALGTTQPPIKWILGALSRGVKRQGRKAHHSPPYSAEVKNGRTIHPLPHTSSWRNT